MLTKKVLIIAEVGNNHNGKIKLAKKSIIEAKKAGADCVKFQYFNSDTLVHKDLRTLKHVKTHKYQLDRLKSLEFSKKQFIELYKFSKKIKIKFCLSFFDPILIKEMINYVDFIKIASSDASNPTILKEANKYNKMIIVSTGLSEQHEIKNISKYIQNKKLIVLHCISKYPTPLNEINLDEINKIKKHFNNVGYSDHTDDIYACCAAVAKGAKVIEKHFLCYENQKDAGDIGVSIGTKKFKEMVYTIRNFEKINAYSKVKNLDYYKKNMLRSPYAKRDLKKNEKISIEDILILRPFKKNGFDIKKLTKQNYTIKNNIKKNSLIKSNEIS